MTSYEHCYKCSKQFLLSILPRTVVFVDVERRMFDDAGPSTCFVHISLRGPNDNILIFFQGKLSNTSESYRQQAKAFPTRRILQQATELTAITTEMSTQWCFRHRSAWRCDLALGVSDCAQWRFLWATGVTSSTLRTELRPPAQPHRIQTFLKQEEHQFKAFSVSTVHSGTIARHRQLKSFSIDWTDPSSYCTLVMPQVFLTFNHTNFSIRE